MSAAELADEKPIQLTSRVTFESRILQVCISASKLADAPFQHKAMPKLLSLALHNLKLTPENVRLHSLKVL